MDKEEIEKIAKEYGIARGFNGLENQYEKSRMEDVLAWLDNNGYAVVKKKQTK